MTSIDYRNWRKNQQTGEYHEKIIGGVDGDISDEWETYEVVYNEDAEFYGFQLREVPLAAALQSSPVSIRIDRKVGAVYTQLTEVPLEIDPSTGQFSVDYEGSGYEGTGRIFFAASELGNTMVVKRYAAVGETVKNPVKDFIVTDTLTVEGEATFEDEAIFESNLITDNNFIVRKPVLYESDSSGAFSTSSAVEIDVTNLSKSITLSNKNTLLLCQLQADGNSDSYIRCINPALSTVSIKIIIYRDSTAIAQYIFRSDPTGASANDMSIPTSSISIYDDPGPGSYTYKIAIAPGIGGQTMFVYYAKLKILIF